MESHIVEITLEQWRAQKAEERLLWKAEWAANPELDEEFWARWGKTPIIVNWDSLNVSMIPSPTPKAKAAENSPLAKNVALCCEPIRPATGSEVLNSHACFGTAKRVRVDP